MATVPLAVEHWGSVRRICLGLAGVGALTFVAGMMVDGPRAWANVLAVSFIGIGLALAGILLPALFRVTGATWAGPLQRPLQAMTALLPMAVVGLGLVFLFRPGLYPWTSETLGEHHHVSAWQHLWLQWPFFLVRAVAYVACWAAFAFFLRRAALFLVVFAITWWLASSDWIMSLEPEWASTMFGLYSFAGLFLSGLAAVTLFVACQQRQLVQAEEGSAKLMHDLGKLLFAFSTFWMYIWFCQYMLIWFVNLPEETSYYVRRLTGAWQPLFVLNVILNWVVPFFVLLPQRNKRNAGLLAKICVVILLGRVVDVYLLVLPTVGAGASAPALLDIGVFLGGAGCFGWAFLNALGRASRFAHLEAPKP